MPSRSDRETYSKAFDKHNPFEDKNPHQIYSEIQWGNAPKKIFKINAPEPLVALGELAALYTSKGDMEFEEQEYFISVGAHRNILYFLPIGVRIQKVPDLDVRKWKRGPLVTETHYYSDKGGEPAYYYHEHEKPFPRLWWSGNIGILVPSNHKGKRSYAVIKEGIVG
jgi:hypothetical protein